MSADLRDRLTAAVGEVRPAPVDTAAVWRRGRRQRHVRQAAPVLAVLAIVGIGVGAVATIASPPEVTDPLAPIEDGRTLDLGWSRYEGGALIAVEEVVDAAEEDVTSLVVNRDFHDLPSGLFDVAPDGTILTLTADGGVRVIAPSGDVTVVSVPVPFFRDADGAAVHTVQLGPDGRLYLTGMAPDAESRQSGLTQVVVMELDGTVVGVRENDAGQRRGFLFVDGYAWQRQQSDDVDQRWQPVAEIGGKVLPMPEQRAGEWNDVVAPDGFAAALGSIGQPDQAPDVAGGVGPLGDIAARTTTEAWAWAFDENEGSMGLEARTPGARPFVTWVDRPAGSFAWVTGEREPDGIIASVVRPDGTLRAVHLPVPLPAGPGDVFVGPDDRLYWTERRPEGTELKRYELPLD